MELLLYAVTMMDKESYIVKATGIGNAGKLGKLKAKMNGLCNEIDHVKLLSV